jgi:hypothetical protein
MAVWCISKCHKPRSRKVCNARVFASNSLDKGATVTWNSITGLTFLPGSNMWKRPS